MPFPERFVHLAWIIMQIAHSDLMCWRSICDNYVHIQPTHEVDNFGNSSKPHSILLKYEFICCYLYVTSLFRHIYLFTSNFCITLVFSFEATHSRMHNLAKLVCLRKISTIKSFYKPVACYYKSST